MVACFDPATTGAARKQHTLIPYLPPARWMGLMLAVQLPEAIAAAIWFETTKDDSLPFPSELKGFGPALPMAFVFTSNLSIILILGRRYSASAEMVDQHCNQIAISQF